MTPAKYVPSALQTLESPRQLVKNASYMLLPRSFYRVSTNVYKSRMDMALYRDCVMAPTNVTLWDPCPSGLPGIQSVVCYTPRERDPVGWPEPSGPG